MGAGEKEGRRTSARVGREEEGKMEEEEERKEVSEVRMEEGRGGGRWRGERKKKG